MHRCEWEVVERWGVGGGGGRCFNWVGSAWRRPTMVVAITYFELSRLRLLNIKKSIQSSIKVLGPEDSIVALSETYGVFGLLGRPTVAGVSTRY